MNYSDEHQRVAAIIGSQYRLTLPMNAGYAYVRVMRNMLTSIAVQMATMYREMDSEFDFPRFLREAQGG